MPGRRLSYQDRRVIAAGLGDWLSYAEIARQLGRPTSTITREVLRNGGPNHYRAGRAQQATKRRAHQGGHSPSGTARPGRLDARVAAFEQQLSATLIDTGMARMPARVLAALHTVDDGSLSVSELTRRLHVSAASVSMAVAYLEEQGMIRRERIPPRRAERYIVDVDAWFQALLTSAQRNQQLADTARAGARLLGVTTSAGGRLDGLSRFHANLAADIVDRAHHWRSTLHAPDA